MHIPEAQMKNLPILEIINMILEIIKKFTKRGKSETISNEQQQISQSFQKKHRRPLHK